MFIADKAIDCSPRRLTQNDAGYADAEFMLTHNGQSRAQWNADLARQAEEDRRQAIIAQFDEPVPGRTALERLQNLIRG